jgi:hypothetical protein
MPTTPCPTGCKRHRDAGKYLCRTCWYRLPVDTRKALTRRGAGAIDRHRALLDAIAAGTPLTDIRIE